MASIKTCFSLNFTNKYSLSYLNSLLINNHHLLTLNNLSNIQWIRLRRTRLSHRWPLTTLPQSIIPDPKVAEKRKSFAESILSPEMAEMRFKYPEFLPDPIPEHRNKICEKLQRKDLIRRRIVIDIPEFYVGSVLAVTISDPFAPGKVSKFVGICIDRQGQGTRSVFTLRNVIDRQGIEIRYDLYNPTIREIQVLKLEKRIDDHLLYLRDALPEYSTIPFDMTPEPHPQGEPVPVNAMKVKMKQWPWSRKWESKGFRGIGQIDDIADYVYLKRGKELNPHQHHDLMVHYRDHITEDDQLEIWDEVKQHEEYVNETRRIERRKKLLSQNEKIKK